MKHCIFFCASLGQGGTERVIDLISGELASQGKIIEIVTYYKRDIFYQIDSRIKVTSVEQESGSCNLIWNFFWLRSYFRKYANVVCSFLSSFNMLALLACYGLGIPVIVSERTDPMYKNGIYRLARDFSYGFADALVVQTQKSYEYFASKCSRRCTLIYNPISPHVKIGNALFTEKKQIVVSVGRLDPLKNQALLLRAFKRVKGSFPEYKLVIYGEGLCRQGLEQLRESLGLDNSVELPGEVHDIFERICSAELFVLSSDFEGMPNALLEAMCLGLPVISTKVVGATEIIEDGYNGLLVDCRDEIGLAHAIGELLGNEQKRRFFAYRATELAIDLDIGRVARQWENLLNDVM